jgi:phosphatidate cytidylyltransferase
VLSVGFVLLSERYHMGGFSLSYFSAIFLGVVLSALGQVSDLCESLIKRDIQVKHSSIIPAMGGVLDMLDSLFFTAPFLYAYLTL